MSQPLNAGEFDHRIALQQPASTQGADGGMTTEWTTLATVWAKRLGAKGREVYAGGVELALVDDVFQVRYGSAWAGIDATWRVMLGSTIYNVSAAVPVGRKERISIVCTAGGNRG